MQYATPAAFRAALETRLAREAEEYGVSLQRLRKRVVFERLLVRLEAARPGTWVVKGGIALEVRLPGRARATKDLDLVMRESAVDGETVQEELGKALGIDTEGDWFEFTVGGPQPLEADAAGRQGWRFTVVASLAGKVFEPVRVDVVLRADEIDATERLSLPGALTFAGLERGDVEVVTAEQHFAEKLHALTRSYGDRPSSRVRDLVDLVILIEGGLVAPKEVLRVAEAVFSSRATHSLPVQIVDPPTGWVDEYERMAADLEIGAKTVDQGMAKVRDFWSQAQGTATGR